MGPLVPFIISNEFNLVFALIAGIGFGFVLEQAGFSSTKKLVGLFYGYDFTVLKVFFTAGVTAMIGVLLFAKIGILDLSLVYINPTFLWSALVGGAIMGVGFIIGGFCPGTSVCAAAIGKLDGLAFVLGGGLGVLVFTEGYPMFEKIYTTEAWGPVLVNEMLGMSKILFGILLSAVAFIAFYVTRLIENRVNGIDTKLSREKMIIYGSAIGIAFMLLIVISVTPDKSDRLASKVNKEINKTDFSAVRVASDKLATEIINNYYKINIIDIRSAEAFKTYHIPFAINIPIEKMDAREWQKIINQRHKANYFYADSQTDAQKAFLMAMHLGEGENYILKESADEFKKTYSNLVPPPGNASKLAINVYNFRKKAASDMASLIEALKNSTQPVVAKATKIKGGC